MRDRRRPAHQPGGRARGLVVAGLAFAPVMIGCHILQLGHLESIHQEPYARVEHYCVEDLSDDPGIVGTADADGWIKEALGIAGTLQGWETLDTIQQVSYGDCANVDTFEEIAELDIRIKMVDESPPLICLGDSCADEGAPLSFHHSHTNYDQFDIYLLADHMVNHGADFRTHLINHEVGHTYGLADPLGSGSSSVQPKGQQCLTAIDRTGDTFQDTVIPVPSIMHNGGLPGIGHCQDTVNFGDLPNYLFPTYFDLLTVDMIAKENPALPWE